MQTPQDPDKIRIFNIRDRFALDIFRLLDVQLQADTLDEQTLSIKILALLNDTRKPYAKQLLFQDFSQPSLHVIEAQSQLYLAEQLITYRLKPAASLQGKLGNMLLLLQALFRKAQAQWAQNAEIKRQAEIQAHSEEYFQKTAEALAHLCQQLEAKLCEVSKGQREKYGILQLYAEQNCAEVPEELSLFEMLRTLPLPLKTLAAEPALSKLILKVIDSLNERYMLLRACGLNPIHWLNCKELSINTLKDMLNLRKTAAHIAQREGLEHDIGLYEKSFKQLQVEKQLQAEKKKAEKKKKDMLNLRKTATHIAQREGLEHDIGLHEKSFKQLQAEKKKVAGFASFIDFSHSEAGEVFLNAFAFIDPITQEVIEELADTEEEKNILFRLEKIEKLIEDYPEAFDKDPVMLHFFRESIAGGLPLCGGEDIDGVLDQAEFQTLIANDERYANLDKATLAKKIYANAKKIINAGHRKCRFQIH